MLNDMDATIPENVGYAVALAHNPRTGETNHTSYRTDEGCNDPVLWAHQFVEASKDDFPGWLWTVTGNGAAQSIHMERIIADVTGEPDPFPDLSDERPSE